MEDITKEYTNGEITIVWQPKKCIHSAVCKNGLIESANTTVSVIKNGPLMVKGTIILKYKDGTEETKNDAYLCRCGQSENKPFCDGTHKKCGFKDE